MSAINRLSPGLESLLGKQSIGLKQKGSIINRWFLGVNSFEAGDKTFTIVRLRIGNRKAILRASPLKSIGLSLNCLPHSIKRRSVYKADGTFLALAKGESVEWQVSV